MRRDLRACGECGSLRIRSPTMVEASMAWNPQLDQWMCSDCGKVSHSLLFDDEAARLAFVESKRS